MGHQNTHSNLGIVDRTAQYSYVFDKTLDDRGVPSLCQISGVRISGRQFFLCEEIRQGKKMFDITFAIPVMRINFN